ncbi:hypothetical protein SERLA73DRAFT_188610 [Serpula lacrymans var. lacrymans S7.3]|uniref:Kinetochore protein SPC25 n=2 Tax=Serpula lacrymans var. lacrymans TaxID=341189 RepID=F8QBT3_SERL3|nr:uncharacterized protein SERLADRAFT_442890 [Serpula lacrymans var. lacrymans S7.9]EGN94052.1 hypothetical protein SERLA73DRAFT_188610 [Serpula lacrymans var. lacrymans S7.3]EGO19405.1 hypothetical protein SERLADRAFT_442890 [Serpula lacrymans var. lacrymans S7.9]
MHRPTHIDLAPTLAESNPLIDLRLRAYDASTGNFLKAVSNYTNRAIVEITKHRSSQITEKKKLAEKTHSIEAETNYCKAKEIELIADLAKEQEEKKEFEQSIAALRRQLGHLRERCAAIDVEIQQFRAATANMRREKENECKTLTSFATQVPPELSTCERRLQCVIEGIERDHLLIRFSHVDQRNPDKEFSFVLDLSCSIYKVTTTTPLLPNLPILLDDLNKTRDIYQFIRSVRRAFVGSLS